MRLGRVRLARIGAILALAALAAIAWFVVLSPRLSEATEVTAQAEQVQTANLTLQTQYNKALDQAQAAPQAAADAQVLFAKMPNDAELPAVLEQITGAATDAGIPAGQVSTVNTGIPEPVNATGTDGTADNATGVQLATMEIAVTASGKRQQILDFLDNLQALDRALLVNGTNVAVVPNDSAGIGGSQAPETLQVSGPMFVLRSKLPDLVAEVERLLEKASQSDTSGTAAG